MNNVRPKNPLLWIKYKILEWRWDRILKRSGHKNWEFYLYWNDPDFNVRGQTVREQFCGYPYVAKVDYKKLPTRFEPLWGPIEYCDDILAWCNQYCRGKYRNHWERVIMDHMGQYAPNGIAGTDELFFGFKDERDYTLFVLRWS